MSPAPPALRLSGVHHAYGGERVLEGVELELVPGEIHGLLGRSGSGKSTLLRLIAGLETLQAGCIEIAGRVVAAPNVALSPERRGVGFVFQDAALFPHLDARENVAFGLAGRRRARLDEAESWLARVGLADRARALPHTLSGGEQQRVALVRALARRPALMLLDEPFSGLDPELREDVRSVALGVLRAAGVAAILVTHDAREALAVGDRLSLLARGRLLQSGAPEALYARPASPEVALAFGPVNRLPVRVEGGRVRFLGQTLAAPGHAEGAAVEVLLRPEALRLDSEGGVPARLLSAVFEGPLRRLHLELEDGTRLEALQPAGSGPAPTGPLRVCCDPNSVTVTELAVRRR